MPTSIPYNRRLWRRTSAVLRAEQPRCVWCGAERGQVRNGRTVRLTVDHIDRDTANNAPTNLRVLCDRCHGSLTADGWRK